jgi:hypothetical protein
VNRLLAEEVLLMVGKSSSLGMAIVGYAQMDLQARELRRG